MHLILKLLIAFHVFLLGMPPQVGMTMGTSGAFWIQQSKQIVDKPLAVKSTDPPENSDERWFEAKIRPLLEQHCLECHSHQSGNMEGGLALDSRSGWAVGGESGPAIVPENASASLLIQAIRHSKNLQMPPNDKLSPDKIRLFEQWVKQGAPDPRQLDYKIDTGQNPREWWSLKPLRAPAPPESALGDTVVHPIDQFVGAQLSKQDLHLSPVAESEVLIRRIYHVLHGLPPTPEQLDHWLNRINSQPDNVSPIWNQLVDTLLDSPRYGERWARHWLDTVHFADTHGCEHDVLRPNAWPYRDYVIDSFNADKSWPRFVREQLAADHFYPEQEHLIPALGFISAGPLELSRAGTAPVTFDYLDRDDIVSQTMAALISTTANCARCHDHKFDPISQEDYYSLQAVFAGGGKGDREFDPDATIRADRQRLNRLLLRVKQRDESLLKDPAFIRKIEVFENDSGQKPAWIPFDMSSITSGQGATLTRLPDGTILASGKKPLTDTYTLVGTGQGIENSGAADRKLKEVAAIRLDVLPHDTLPAGGPGRCENGNLHLNDIEVFLTTDHGTPDESQVKLEISFATADWNQQGWTIQHAIDQNRKSAWGIYPQVAQPHFAIFRLKQPVAVSPKTRITIRLHQIHGGSHLIGRFQIYLTDSSSESVQVLPESVRNSLSIDPSQRTVAQRLDLATFILQRELDQKLSELPPVQKVYAWSRFFSHAKQQEQPLPVKTVNVLRRGNIHLPGPVAVPGALSVVDNLPSRFLTSIGKDESFRRAALANWLTDHENPLFWRSIVNRIWSYHFGRGICRTPNDLGRMGATPSHPELVDWLAIWFRDEAQGSIKKLHRLILTSHTWQQSSQPKASQYRQRALELDVENQWIWKSPLRKLDAESFRDSILQISGAIDWKMGGPGVEQFTKSKGQQTTPKLNYQAFDWNSPSGRRRSIYRVVWRGIADPFMESLDFPDLGLLVGQREESSSSLQALSTFNNDFVLHFSGILAEKLTHDHPRLEDQVQRACRLIWLRPPSALEKAELTGYVKTHSLAALCRVLFNSNEFMFVR